MQGGAPTLLQGVSPKARETAALLCYSRRSIKLDRRKIAIDTEENLDYGG